MVKPGVLQFMGSQRVGLDLVTERQQITKRKQTQKKRRSQRLERGEGRRGWGIQGWRVQWYRLLWKTCYKMPGTVQGAQPMLDNNCEGSPASKDCESLCRRL